MPIRILTSTNHPIRYVEFSGSVHSRELDLIARVYMDRDFYRFPDKEIVVFTPDVSLVEIEAEQLGQLADHYIEAVRTRNDTAPVHSVWVMGDQVRNEARLWRSFMQDPELMRMERQHADTLEAAFATHGFPEEWAQGLRAGIGYRSFAERSTVAG